MSLQKLTAEFVGTLALTFLVICSLVFSVSFPTPVIAGLTLGLFVYLLASVSGAHFNPAITIAMFSIGKIKAKEGFLYIVSQFLGALCACGLAKALFEMQPNLVVSSDTIVGVGEGLGAAFFAFGVTTVVFKRVSDVMSGIVVGTSLFIGITVASSMSNGVLNPAVAFGIRSFGAAYVIGPVIGAIFGSFLACFVHGEKVKFGK